MRRARVCAQSLAWLRCWGLRAVIVKASSGPRYVVGCRSKVDKTKVRALGASAVLHPSASTPVVSLQQTACVAEPPATCPAAALQLTTNTRVALDMTTLTIMRALPREVRCSYGSSTTSSDSNCM